MWRISDMWRILDFLLYQIGLSTMTYSLNIGLNSVLTYCVGIVIQNKKVPHV